MPQLLCSVCKSPLVQIPFYGRCRNICPYHHGMAISISALRKWIVPDSIPILTTALQDEKIGTRPCASCRQTMKIFTFAQLKLDHCTSCEMIWFDAGEFESFPLQSEKALEEDDESDFQVTIQPGIHFRNNFSPFENIKGQNNASPTATLFLLMACFPASYLMRINHGGAFLFDSAHPFRLAGFPIILSLFAHANLVHFLGNAFFLLVVGGIIETTLGLNALLQIFFFSGVAGNIAFALLSQGKCLGASGAISGLVVAMVLTQPKARYVSQETDFNLRGFSFLTYTTKYPLWIWGAGFFLFQIYSASLQTIGNIHSNIGYIAHAGGAIAAMVYVFSTDLKVLTPVTKRG